MGNNNEILKIANLKAMMEQDHQKVLELCLEVLPDGPLQRIGVYDDTVLHIAAHCKHEELVINLLEMVPESHYFDLSGIKSADGNTILHEIATSSAMIDAAKVALGKNRNLLTEPNKSGEKPIFCAARCGQTEMFKFLADEMKLKNLAEQSKPHLRRDDGTTVLHISMAAECFDLAHHVADNYSFLIKERDGAKMTALQCLARNPSAFQERKCTMHDFHSDSLSSLVEEMIDEIRSSRRRRHAARNRESLNELLVLLAKSDFSWDDISNNSQEGNQGNDHDQRNDDSTINSQGAKQGAIDKSEESPLFLATMSNIPEIVAAVLEHRPKAFIYADKNGMNIFHIAIRYRSIDVFDMVMKSDHMLAERLLSATDNDGNSVLHMVGQKIDQGTGMTTLSVVRLREELLLFKKVKYATKTVLSKSKKESAKKLFAASIVDLHKEAEKWLLNSVQNNIILSIFISTVAFAAVNTVPGGPDQNTGTPILGSRTFCKVFIIADMLSLTFSLASMAMYSSILISSSVSLKAFETHLLPYVLAGVTYSIISVLAMVVAFGATIALIFPSYTLVGFAPVPFVIVLCLPVYPSFLAIVFRPVLHSIFKWVDRSLSGVICKFVLCGPTQAPNPPRSPCAVV